MRTLIGAVLALALVAGCSEGAAPRPSASSTPPPTSSTAPVAKPPRFENAQIMVASGIDRAYVSYTIIGSGPNQYASIDKIRAVNDAGERITWHHQTATGGPADIVATEGRITIPAGSPEGGDADYFDALDVTSSKIVRVTFYFDSGPVTVPFAVVDAYPE